MRSPSWSRLSELVSQLQKHSGHPTRASVKNGSIRSPARLGDSRRATAMGRGSAAAPRPPGGIDVRIRPAAALRSKAGTDGDWGRCIAALQQPEEAIVITSIPAGGRPCGRAWETSSPTPAGVAPPPPSSGAAGRVAARSATASFRLRAVRSARLSGCHRRSWSGQGHVVRWPVALQNASVISRNVRTLRQSARNTLGRHSARTGRRISGLNRLVAGRLIGGSHAAADCSGVRASAATGRDDSLRSCS